MVVTCVLLLPVIYYSIFTEAPMDYGGIATLLMFGSCKTRVCISVTIVNDNSVEGTEHFSASLGRTDNLDPRITIDPHFARVEIVDDGNGMQRVLVHHIGIFFN